VPAGPRGRLAAISQTTTHMHGHHEATMGLAGVPGPSTATPPVAGMSQSNVPDSKLDHLDLLVCKLSIFNCQSANSSILQTCEGVD
jgi:hypothetical protein